MKRLNNSRPLAVAVSYAPLSTSMHIVSRSGAPLVQFYYQVQQQWKPDHTHSFNVDDYGAQTDGPLTLAADWSIIDGDGLISGDVLSPQIYWYADGAQVTTTDQYQDFYINDGLLVVRRNATHLAPVVVTCECHFTDTRTQSPFVLSDEVTLTAQLVADEQWSISILTDRTRHHFPITSSSSIYTFEAEARLGVTDCTQTVRWQWDYSDDSGQTWKSISDNGLDTLWYISGANENTLTVDADFFDHITVRVRAAKDKLTSTQSFLPNAATATLAWRTPLVRPVVCCDGGDRVLADSDYMTFSLIAHNPRHEDLTMQQQREWLLCDWTVRRQQSSANPLRLGVYEARAKVPAGLFRTLADTKSVADPCVSLRGSRRALCTSNGDYIKASNGKIIAIRS